jgi:hypothetical protein
MKRAPTRSFAVIIDFCKDPVPGKDQLPTIKLPGSHPRCGGMAGNVSLIMGYFLIVAEWRAP